MMKERNSTEFSTMAACTGEDAMIFFRGVEYELKTRKSFEGVLKIPSPHRRVFIPATHIVNKNPHIIKHIKDPSEKIQC